jgi:hypothetical protein
MILTYEDIAQARQQYKAGWLRELVADMRKNEKLLIMEEAKKYKQENKLH